jgi:hypothetical protein
MRKIGYGYNALTATVIAGNNAQTVNFGYNAAVNVTF